MKILISSYKISIFAFAKIVLERRYLGMINVLLALGVNNISTNRPLCQNNERMGRTTNIPNLLFPQYTHCFVSFRGAELGGLGGRALAPNLLEIYLVNFGNFLKIRFSLFTVAPHKKIVSAHPD